MSQDILLNWHGDVPIFQRICFQRLESSTKRFTTSAPASCSAATTTSYLNHNLILFLISRQLQCSYNNLLSQSQPHTFPYIPPAAVQLQQPLISITTSYFSLYPASCSAATTTSYLNHNLILFLISRQLQCSYNNLLSQSQPHTFPYIPPAAVQLQQPLISITTSYFSLYPTSCSAATTTSYLNHNLILFLISRQLQCSYNNLLSQSQPHTFPYIPPAAVQLQQPLISITTSYFSLYPASCSAATTTSYLNHNLILFLISHQLQCSYNNLLSQSQPHTFPYIPPAAVQLQQPLISITTSYFSLYPASCSAATNSYLNHNLILFLISRQLQCSNKLLSQSQPHTFPYIPPAAVQLQQPLISITTSYFSLYPTSCSAATTTSYLNHNLILFLISRQLQCSYNNLLSQSQPHTFPYIPPAAVQLQQPLISITTSYFSLYPTSCSAATTTSYLNHNLILFLISRQLQCSNKLLSQSQPHTFPYIPPAAVQQQTLISITTSYFSLYPASCSAATNSYLNHNLILFLISRQLQCSNKLLSQSQPHTFPYIPPAAVQQQTLISITTSYFSLYPASCSAATNSYLNHNLILFLISRQLQCSNKLLSQSQPHTFPYIPPAAVQQQTLISITTSYFSLYPASCSAATNSYLNHNLILFLISRQLQCSNKLLSQSQPHTFPYIPPAAVQLQQTLISITTSYFSLYPASCSAATNSYLNHNLILFLISRQLQCSNKLLSQSQPHTFPYIPPAAVQQQTLISITTSYFSLYPASCSAATNSYLNHNLILFLISHQLQCSYNKLLSQSQPHTFPYIPPAAVQQQTLISITTSYFSLYPASCSAATNSYLNHNLILFLISRQLQCSNKLLSQSQPHTFPYIPPAAVQQQTLISITTSYFSLYPASCSAATTNSYLNHNLILFLISRQLQCSNKLLSQSQPHTFPYIPPAAVQQQTLISITTSYFSLYPASCSAATNSYLNHNLILFLISRQLQCSNKLLSQSQPHTFPYIPPAAVQQQTLISITTSYFSLYPASCSAATNSHLNHNLILFLISRQLQCSNKLLSQSQPHTFPYIPPAAVQQQTLISITTSYFSLYPASCSAATNSYLNHNLILFLISHQLQCSYNKLLSQSQPHTFPYIPPAAVQQQTLISITTSYFSLYPASCSAATNSYLNHNLILFLISRQLQCSNKLLSQSQPHTFPYIPPAAVQQQTLISITTSYFSLYPTSCSAATTNSYLNHNLILFLISRQLQCSNKLLSQSQPHTFPYIPPAAVQQQTLISITTSYFSLYPASCSAATNSYLNHNLILFLISRQLQCSNKLLSQSQPHTFPYIPPAAVQLQQTLISIFWNTILDIISVVISNSQTSFTHLYYFPQFVISNIITVLQTYVPVIFVR